MTRLIVALLLAFMTVACAPTPDSDHKPYWQVTLIAPADMQDQVASAAEEWNVALGRDVFKMGAYPAEYGLKGYGYFRVASDAEMGRAGGWTLSDTGHHFDVLIRGDMVNRREVFLHELGHVLMGDDHFDEPGDLMHADVAPVGAPITDAHVDAVCAFWGWDPEFRPED